MKKLKNIFMVLICVFMCSIFCVSCKKTEQIISINDLNNDGIEESWEVPFNKLEDSKIVTDLGENTTTEINGKVFQIVNIETVEDFNASIFSQAETNKIYVLRNDLDFNGGSISIKDLSGSYFYGNNKTISNFKLSSNNNVTKYGIFENALGVYDLNIFIGMAEINIYRSDNAMFISPLFNCELISNVNVKGYIHILKNCETNAYGNDKYLSLLSTVSDKIGVQIENSKVDGYIAVTETASDRNTLNNAKYQTKDRFMIGGLCASISGGVIKNSEAKIKNVLITKSSIEAGSICGLVENDSFIENNTFDYIYKKQSFKTKEKPVTYDIVGGIVGETINSEIKNSSGRFVCNIDDRNISIDVQNIVTASGDTQTKDIDSATNIAVGGAIGNLKNSIISYSNIKGSINVENLESAVVGGLVGAQKSSILRKAITQVDVSISNTKTLYASNMIANAYLGLVEGCVSKNSVNLDRTYDISVKTNSGLELSGDKNEKDYKRINVGLVLFQSSFFNNLYNEIIENSNSTTYIDAKNFGDDTINKIESVSEDFDKLETKTILTPSINKTFSESTFNISVQANDKSLYSKQEKLSSRIATFLVDESQINFGGLLYAYNSAGLKTRSQAFKNNYYKSLIVNINENSKQDLGKPWINYVAGSKFVVVATNKETVSEKELKSFITNDFFETIDNVVVSESESGTIYDKISFKNIEGSVFKDYGDSRKRIKISNINFDSFVQKDSSNIFEIDKNSEQANFVNNGITYLYEIGGKASDVFYGVYKFNKTQLDLDGLAKQLTKNLVLCKIKEGNVVKNIYAYNKNSFNQNASEEHKNNKDANELACYNDLDDAINLYVLNYLCSFIGAPNSGTDVTIKYVEIVAIGDRTIFDVYYPEINGKTRIDRIEINRLQPITDNPRALYVISTIINFDPLNE